MSTGNKSLETISDTDNEAETVAMGHRSESWKCISTYQNQDRQSLSGRICTHVCKLPQ